MKKSSKKIIITFCALALAFVAVAGTYKIIPLIDPPYPLVNLVEGLLK